MNREQDINQFEGNGHFTLVVEADKVENALDKFRDLIKNYSSENEVLDGIKEIFLEACLECKDIPDEGFISYYEESWASLHGTISTACVGATDEQVVEYGYGVEDPDEDEPQDVEPFLVLD